MYSLRIVPTSAGFLATIESAGARIATAVRAVSDRNYAAMLGVALINQMRRANV